MLGNVSRTYCKTYRKQYMERIGNTQRGAANISVTDQRTYRKTLLTVNYRTRYHRTYIKRIGEHIRKRIRNHIENVYKTYRGTYNIIMRNVLETQWKHNGNILKTYGKTSESIS